MRHCLHHRAARSLASLLAPLLAVALSLLLPLAAAAATGQDSVMPGGGTMEADWRLEVLPAVAVQDQLVRLGDLARPLGEIPAGRWEELAAMPLWHAPQKRGDQQRITRDVLAHLLRKKLGVVSALCMLPPYTVIQRGGAVLDAGDLNKLVVETLTPRMHALQGEAALRDMRLPEYVFLDDRMDTVKVSVIGDLEPGRLSLRFEIVGPDGEVRDRHTGQVFMDLWITAPVAARPLNRGDALSPEVVTHRRVNAAFLRDEPWDGRDFNLRATSPVGTDQVIYAKNLEMVPTIARGDTVQLVYNGRYVHLSVDAEALADGQAGDYIPVRNTQSRRQVMAQVRDGDTVEVK